MALLVLCAASAAGDGAATDAQPGSLEWFRAIWKEATEWKPPTGITVSYQFVERQTVNQSEVDDLIAQGAGDIMHPRHSGLARLLLLQENPTWPANVDLMLFAQGWRVDRERLSDALAPAERWETVAEGKTRWQLRPGSLLVTDKTEPEEHFSFDNEAVMIDKYLRAHAWFGMGAPPTSKWQLKPISSDLAADGSWVGVVVSADGKVNKQFTGRIDDGGGLFVTRAEIVEARDEYAYALGQSWDFDLPSPGNFLSDSTIALRVVWTSPVVGMTQVRTLVAMATIPQEMLDNPTVLEPPIGGHDALRGEVAVHQLREVSEGREQRSTITETGAQQVVDPDSGAWWRTGKRRSVMFVGWLSAGVVIAIVVALRIWTVRGKG